MTTPAPNIRPLETGTWPTAPLAKPVEIWRPEPTHCGQLDYLLQDWMSVPRAAGTEWDRELVSQIWAHMSWCDDCQAMRRKVEQWRLEQKARKEAGEGHEHD